MNVLSIVLKIALYVLEVIGLFKLYGKMGEKQWVAIVPFYKEYAIYKRVYNVKAFWLYLLCDILAYLMVSIENPSTVIYIISILAILVYIVIKFKFAQGFAAAFGKGTGFAWLAFIFPFAVYMYTGYSKDVKYVGNRK